MNILYTLNSGEPGGMEQHVLDLVAQMILRGHKVYVWCKTGVICDWYKKAGAEVWEVPIKHDIDLSYIKDLRKFIVKNNIDVVHAHEIKAVVNSLIAASLARAKVRISHTHTPISHWQVNKYKRLFDALVYACMVRLFGSKEIALTESIKKVKIKDGVPAVKLCVIPNGIDVYKYTLGENERANFRREILRKYHLDPLTKIVGNISRTTEEKGHGLLLAAFAKLVDHGILDRTKWVLMICGGGKLEEALWNEAGRLGVKDRLIITGRFDDDFKIKYYCAFDCFAFPSLAEGFGLVLIEALSLGLPVVASDLAVLKEVGGSYCTFFRAGNADDLAEKLSERIGHPLSAGEKMAEENYVKNNYSLAKFGENYERLYQSLAPGGL